MRVENVAYMERKSLFEDRCVGNHFHDYRPLTGFHGRARPGMPPSSPHLDEGVEVGAPLKYCLSLRLSRAATAHLRVERWLPPWLFLLHVFLLLSPYSHLPRTPAYIQMLLKPC